MTTFERCYGDTCVDHEVIVDDLKVCFFPNSEILSPLGNRRCLGRTKQESHLKSHYYARARNCVKYIFLGCYEIFHPSYLQIHMCAFFLTSHTPHHLSPALSSPLLSLPVSCSEILKLLSLLTA